MVKFNFGLGNDDNDNSGNGSSQTDDGVKKEEVDNSTVVAKEPVIENVQTTKEEKNETSAIPETITIDNTQIPDSKPTEEIAKNINLKDVNNLPGEPSPEISSSAIANFDDKKTEEPETKKEIFSPSPVFPERPVVAKGANVTPVFQSKPEEFSKKETNTSVNTAPAIQPKENIPTASIKEENDKPVKNNITPIIQPKENIPTTSIKEENDKPAKNNITPIIQPKINISQNTTKQKEDKAPKITTSNTIATKETVVPQKIESKPTISDDTNFTAKVEEIKSAMTNYKNKKEAEISDLKKQKNDYLQQSNECDQKIITIKNEIKNKGTEYHTVVLSITDLEKTFNNNHSLGNKQTNKKAA